MSLTLKANSVVAEATCKGDHELEEANTDLRETFTRTLMARYPDPCRPRGQKECLVIYHTSDHNPSNWKSASKVQMIARIHMVSFSALNFYTPPARRGKNYEATVKETCQMASSKRPRTTICHLMDSKLVPPLLLCAI